MAKIVTGVQVKVVKGKDAGKTGEVARVLRATTKAGTAADKVIVKGINTVKRHVKPNQNLGITGGIIDIEKPISIANVRLLENKKSTKKAEKADK